MRKYIFLATVVLIGLMIGRVETNAAKNFEDYCDDALVTMQTFHPVLSTRMGIHSYDHRLTDYSSNSIKSYLKKLKKHRKDLNRYKKVDLNPYRRINYNLIQSNIDMAIYELEDLKWHRKAPQLYVKDAIEGLYTLMVSRHAPLEEKLYSIISRMEAVPGLFATARKNLKQPPPLFIAQAKKSLEDGIDFYQDCGSELMSAFPDRADEILKKTTRAREAMNDFLNYLDTIKTGEDNSIAIGQDAYDYFLKTEYFLDFDADSLLVLTENLFDEISSAYGSYLHYVETSRQDGQDSVFVPASFTPEDVIDYYNWEIDQEKLFLDNRQIVTIPETSGDIFVSEIPPYLNKLVNGQIFVPAGPFEENQESYILVRPMPEEPDSRQLAARYRYVYRRGFKNTVVREAYPGRHLQQQVAVQINDPVRLWQENDMITQSWPLYCEEMMYNAGLFGKEDPAQWLLVLKNLQQQAALALVDIKLHTKRMTYEECLDWVINVLNIETRSGREYVESELNRIAYKPTSAMAGLIGRKEIIDMRNIMMAREGGRFDNKKFHDMILKEGMIPPQLILEDMRAEADFGS